jgi:hypothetical protein
VPLGPDDDCYQMSSGLKTLSIAGEMKYGLDNGACRNGEGTGDHIEVDTQLSAQQREHDEETDQDYQPVWLQLIVLKANGIAVIRLDCTNAQS